MKRYILIIALLSTLSATTTTTTNLLAYDIVVLKDSDIIPYNKALEGFKNGVNINVTKNVNITEYVLGANTDIIKKRDKIIDDIGAKSPDIILAIGRNSMLMIENEFNDIPVVYCMIMDPENYAFIKKDNVTGIILRTPIKEQIKKLMSIVPDLNNLGVIYNDKNTKHVIKDARQVLKKAGINLVEAKVKSEKSVPKAFRKLVKNIDALWIPPDATVITSMSIKFIILRAFANNLPLMVHAEKLVEAGALLSLSADYYKIGEQTADLVKDILIENKKITTPIVQPKKKNFILNLKTAKKIGLDAPDDVVNFADKVYN